MMTFQSKLGTLKVQTRLNDFFNIENYICKNDSSTFLLKLYKFYEFEIYYQRELQTIESLSHIPEVLQIKDHQMSKSSGYIIYELGKLSHLPSTPIKPADELGLVSNILAVVEKIHKTNLIHTGLNPHNFFISADLKVKIMGFETCTTLEELTELWKNGQILILAQENEWKSPELCDSGYPVSVSLDLWSLGCLFFYLFRGNKLEGLEDSIQNGFVEISNLKSRTILKKLLIVDPELRGTIESTRAILASNLPESEKRLSAFSQMISRSTRSWLKSVTKDKDSPPKKLVIAKLLKKASEKPEKIPKFYSHLASRPFYKPRVVLKSLLVLHIYWFAGKTQNLSQSAFEILDKIFAVWTDARTRQKYFSGSTKQMVLEYIQILKTKLRVHSEFLINCDWSDCDLDLKYFDEVLDFFKGISKFANIVFNMNEHVEIYLEILNLLLKEIMKITQVFINSADRMKNERVQEFLEIRAKNSALVQKIYLKYPFLEISVFKDYLGQSLSQILSHGGSLQESLSNLSSICTSPAEQSASSDSESLPRSRSSSLFEGLEFEEMIGEGGSAKVYKGRYRNMQVAIKQMKTSLHKNDFLAEFNREIQTLSKLSHPNLVTFVGACVGEQHCIVTEFCSGGTLFALLHEQRTLKVSWKQRTKLASDIAKGMQYLHSFNLLHRDLKSLNILLTEQLSGNNEPVAKISDFGVARVLGDGIMTGSIGTCHWMAPEVIRGDNYGLSSDVFSFGIVMYELLSRETPYKGLDPKNIAYSVVNLRKRPDVNLIASSCPSELKDLMIRCWNENPELRPSFSEIVKELNKLL